MAKDYRDRFDHQVEFIGAVNHTRYTVRLFRRDEPGFVEVVQTINALGVAVLHQVHRARPTFRPRERNHRRSPRISRVSSSASMLTVKNSRKAQCGPIHGPGDERRRHMPARAALTVHIPRAGVQCG